MCVVLTKQTALPECIYTRTYYVRCGELKYAMSFVDTPHSLGAGAMVVVTIVALRA